MNRIISDDAIAIIVAIDAIFQVYKSVKNKFTIKSCVIIGIYIIICLFSWCNNNEKNIKEEAHQRNDSISNKRIECLVESIKGILPDFLKEIES